MSAEMRSQIIGSIRAGGYPHVAAEAWGMPKEIFDDWMRRAAEPKAREPQRSFARDVKLAFAQARLSAEISVFKDEPKIWLIHGPGREKDDSPGWSVSVKPAELSVAGRNVLLDPELMQLFHIVLKALEPHEEARLAVAHALVKLGIPMTI
jgi:hypothetical protein